MRLITILFLGCLWGSAHAEQPAEAKTAPPPVPVPSGDAPDEPQVTITKEVGQTVEEYRSNGKLYMIKVTPKHGKPYYLIDDRGDGKFARQESLDSGLRVPQWVIFKF